MDGIHKSIFIVALGVLAGMIVRPILATFLNPLLGGIKLAL